MTTITDEEWELLKEFGKKLPEIPEKLDLKMIRKILQNPYSIEYLFDGYRRDLKEKITNAKDMEAVTSRLSCDSDLQYAFKLMLFLETKNLEMFKEHLDMIEALAFHSVEIQKDLHKLIRFIKPTKNKSAELEQFLKKISEKEKKNTQFVKDYQEKLPYVKQFKDYLDNEARNTTQD